MIGMGVGISDAQRLCTAVQAAGEQVPAQLSNTLGGLDLLTGLAAIPDPARAVVDAARAGDLTADTLRDLLTDAALKHMVADYSGHLRGRAERLFLEAFFQVLENGAADEILTSLRPDFDAAAEAVAEARELIPVSAPAEQFLSEATPEAVVAWQSLDIHINKLNAIGLVASLFGPRSQKFALVEEYALADNFRLHDRALFCADGDLEADSKVFNGPGVHRASPWFRIGRLRLHSVESARERYRIYAEAEWNRLNAGRLVQRYTESGELEDVPIKNPYARTEATTT
jgi:hypothetical protein